MDNHLAAVILILQLCLKPGTIAQFTSETYPDPSYNILGCRIATVGPVCDPSELLTMQEKEQLAERINQLSAYSRTIPNTSPQCLSSLHSNLKVIVAVIDKIGLVPTGPVDIEKFANNLKSRYQHFQDPNLCDTMVLIVNSKSDRQVFTVAGKDTKLTKEDLKNAFEQNIEHFRANQFANGLQGMVEFVSEAYIVAQNPQLKVPQTTSTENNIGSRSVDSGVRQTIDNLISATTPAMLIPSGSGMEVGTVTNGELGNLTNQLQIENASDQLWVNIMAQAVARCGNNQERLGRYIRAVVEDAMSLSLKLISDERYTLIEDEAQDTAGDPDARNRAWMNSKYRFIDPLYKKYEKLIRSRANQRCPARSETTKTVMGLKHSL